jgi:hypothetical protein
MAPLQQIDGQPFVDQPDQNTMPGSVLDGAHGRGRQQEHLSIVEMDVPELAENARLAVRGSDDRQMATPLERDGLGGGMLDADEGFGPVNGAGR